MHWLQVSQVAKAMVVQCGFDKELGQVAWQQQGEQTFVGQQMGQPPQCSAHVANQIDNAVKAIVEKAYRYAPLCWARSCARCWPDELPHASVLHSVMGAFVAACWLTVFSHLSNR